VENVDVHPCRSHQLNCEVYTGGSEVVHGDKCAHQFGIKPSMHRIRQRVPVV